MKLEWIDSFNLGVPEIDGDHRIMLVLMKLVQSSAESGDRPRVEHFLDRLFDYARSHYSREEDLLHRWGYPNVEEHALYHAGLVDSAKTMRRHCAETQSPEAFKDCCESLMSFLVDDVLRGDMQLKSFLEHTGLTLPR